ncbi:helix-turn-helix domain-containing protein [Duganella hordei]|uniref:helix-turn-helix domain-containing protein n=1 Tax=Duganella hordei TaxID=2865934 RepID=UPI0033416FB3
MKNASSEANETEVLRSLGVVIKNARKDKGLSQEEFAHLCRIDRSHMGRIERGERNLAILNFVRICRALDVTPSEVFARAGQ